MDAIAYVEIKESMVNVYHMVILHVIKMNILQHRTRVWNNVLQIPLNVLRNMPTDCVSASQDT